VIAAKRVHTHLAFYLGCQNAMGAITFCSPVALCTCHLRRPTRDEFSALREQRKRSDLTPRYGGRDVGDEPRTQQALPLWSSFQLRPAWQPAGDSGPRERIKQWPVLRSCIVPVAGQCVLFSSLHTEQIAAVWLRQFAVGSHGDTTSRAVTSVETSFLRNDKPGLRSNAMESDFQEF
jgi:hypothetical protein